MMGRRRSDEDFQREIEAHIEIEADRLVADGMSRRQALAAARRAFGNVTRSRERFYEAGRWMWLDHLRRDVRHAGKQILGAPVAAAIVVVSLALGIGFNTAIFSLADQALLRALPVARPDQLVLLDWHGSFVGGGVGTDNLFPHQFYRELRQQNDVFSDMFAHCPAPVQLATGRQAEPVGAELVSGSYFKTLGVRPALGRLLDDGDDLVPDGHPVVVLSYDYWRSRLGADPRVAGRRVLVNSHPMVVVGVAAPGFHGVDWGAAPALWLPIMMKRQATPSWDGLFDRRTRWLHVFGRLRPGIAPDQARARLQVWFKSYLAADTRREGWPPVTPAQLNAYMASTLELLPAAQGRSDLRRQMREPILILLAATALILLLACLNVANLSLAKTLARRQEIATRVALGAWRRRILAERLIESCVLAVLGSGAGLLLAPLVSRGILTFLPAAAGGTGTGAGGGMALRPDLDLRVLGFALVVTVLTALFSGAAPALYATSVSPASALRQRWSTVAGGFGLRRALVVGQFALALILLVGAGLFVRTLGALRLQGPGFATANLVMFRLEPQSSGYQQTRAKPVEKQVLAAIQELPEVELAGATRWEMLTGGGWNNPLTVAGRRRFVTEDLPMNSVSPGFFATLGAPLVRGRDFKDQDALYGADGKLRSPDVAIVNQEFVRQYFQGEEPLGARLGIGDGPDAVPDTEIVGVVRDFHDNHLRETEPEVFFPLWAGRASEATYYVRTRSATEVVFPLIRAAVRRIDPALAVLSLRTLDDQQDRMLANERMLATLAGGFAVLATLLAMIGLYGVLSFSAASRTREIGIRLALGAPRRAALGLILREAAALAVGGIAIALPASWLLGRLVESQLFGVHSMDALTIAAATLVLVCVCLAASAGPAQRAAAVDPLNTLRGE
jgi:predicted permease